MWTVEDNRLTHDDLPEALTATMDEPYPPFWWYVSAGRLTHVGLPSPMGAGAFFGCTNLEKVHIPESVKHIGDFAFAETALTSVKIAADCTYSASSFPEGCVIEYYESEVNNNG